MRLRPIVFLLLVAPLLQAQSESALRSFFEGKQVRVKIDMPATHDGVDCHVGNAPPLDYKEYSNRVRRFGIALHTGEEAMITGIKIKDKNIEFQLGGGGYGVAGDDSGNVFARIVPKSEREKQLEHDLRDETDRDRREQMKRELNRLRDRRESENRYDRDEAARASAIRQREIAETRLSAGSRFNLWYPEGALKASVPTPREVMTLLSEWVDFGTLNRAEWRPVLKRSLSAPWETYATNRRARLWPAALDLQAKSYFAASNQNHLLPRRVALLERSRSHLPWSGAAPLLRSRPSRNRFR